ncbi:aldehyde dehydrogenase [Sphingopyxis macrogoltabida]|uniref:Aldehyde dehydrogenase n=1 Tax=Sphingopyxis macrogoltabida TaxID=33050 RepID=A0AAC9AZS8_SPHMC|nr:aldehyde dehydrogenase [Sphingopyxis macrogoltabida]
MTPATIAPLEHPDRLFINGDWVKPAGTGMIDVIDSASENIFARVAEAGNGDIDRAVVAARRAFDEGPWPRMSHSQRAGFLHAIADELDARVTDLAHIWTSESGILASDASQGSAGLGPFFRYYADLAETFPFVERHTPSQGNVGLLVREPVGVVAAIIPWNGPAFLLAAKCAPALLAGCTIVLKASPEAPASAYLFAEICGKVGIPKGVVNVLTADREVSELLVRHSGVDKVTFTGSTAAGRRIASICGDRVARCTLELGGKSAGVILDDYDLESAATTIAAAAPYLAGQVCASLTRIIVSRSRHDAFVEALAASFGSLRVGDPNDAASQMGPLATGRQRERVESCVAQGKADGALLVAGGKRPPQFDRGFYFEPTVFANVDNNLAIAQKEIFGPVLCVIPVDDERDAIKIANDTIYGLNASVFTNDIDRAYSFGRKLRSGTVGHNSYRNDFTIAFGGFKQSGIGREGGREGLLPFLESKTMILDAMPRGLDI